MMTKIARIHGAQKRVKRQSIRPLSLCKEGEEKNGTFHLLPAMHQSDYSQRRHALFLALDDEMSILRCEAERNAGHPVFAAGRRMHRPVVYFRDVPNQDICCSLLAYRRSRADDHRVSCYTLSHLLALRARQRHNPVQKRALSGKKRM